MAEKVQFEGSTEKIITDDNEDNVSDNQDAIYSLDQSDLSTVDSGDLNASVQKKIISNVNVEDFSGNLDMTTSKYDEKDAVVNQTFNLLCSPMDFIEAIFNTPKDVILPHKLEQIRERLNKKAASDIVSDAIQTDSVSNAKQRVTETEMTEVVIDTVEAEETLETISTVNEDEDFNLKITWRDIFRKMFRYDLKCGVPHYFGLGVLVVSVIVTIFVSLRFASII